MESSEESSVSVASTARWRFTFGPQRFWLHGALFVITFFTTTLAGVQWRGGNALELTNFTMGLEYSTLLLLFLTSHEMGHFVAARWHGVQATLPFYIPLPTTLLGPGFGTLGAVIRTRTRIPSRRAVFDIGVAGPIAGFIVCVCILAVGFATLPGIEYLQAIHPGYPKVPEAGGADLTFGRTLLYSLFEKVFARTGSYVPPMSEMYHYPMLCVGWFGLFVTSLNLLPVGQLDGGHLFYGLVNSRWHRIIGKVTASVLFLIGVPALLVDLGDAGVFHAPEWLKSVAIAGGSTWLLWAFIVAFVIRFKHPESPDERPLDTKRVLIGLFTIVIFVLCFTPSPLILSGN